MKVLSISNNQNIASRGKGMNDSLEHLGNITKKSLGAGQVTRRTSKRALSREHLLNGHFTEIDGVEDPIKRFSNTMKKRFASVKVILRQPKRVLTREQIRNTCSKLFNPQKLNPNNK